MNSAPDRVSYDVCFCVCVCWSFLSPRSLLIALRVLSEDVNTEESVISRDE